MSLLEAQRNQPSIYCHTPTPEETLPRGGGRACSFAGGTTPPYWKEKLELSHTAVLGFQSHHTQMVQATEMIAGSTIFSRFRDGPSVLFFIKYRR